MPKQEYKILEFHGGTNNKFDARDIEDNQNAFSRLSIRNVGRLTKEGSLTNLYNKTNISGHTISNVTSSDGGFEKTYGLFSFAHDYDMNSTPAEGDTSFICINDANEIDIYDPNTSGIGTEIVQNGDDVDPGDTNWGTANSDGDGADAWSSANPSVFDTSANEDASIYNTLSGDKLQANVNYVLSFDVVTASLNLAIGGGDASGDTADETYIAAADYGVGRHVVSFTPAAAATHLWFTADSSEISADASINNVSCSISGWNDAKLTLGSRTATVKPEYYNVDGALRVCDSNFQVTSTGYLTNKDPHTKNDEVLTIDTGSAAIAAGSIIQINQEIMYVTTGCGSSGTSLTVIRGFANTEISQHSNNSSISYVNVPKYFGHIKQDRLFQCAESNSINTWVEDIGTPQPPNNTRKSDGTTGTLAPSLGIQSLRVYDTISGSTANYPSESEKVVLEFGDDTPDFGIIAVSRSEDVVTITTSGNGDSETADHGLTAGDEIVISNVSHASTSLTKLAGTHTVESRLNSTSFTIIIEGYDEADLDYASNDTAIQDWGDYSATIPGTLSIDVTDTELPPSGNFPIHITGQTGVPAFNGVYFATAIDNDECYFTHASHGDAGDGDTTGQLQLLLGTITKSGEDAIDEDLKRKWNFAMSFTYNGPGQEVQESLLTQGYKITPVLQASGAANLHALGSTVALDATTIVVDDGTQFNAGDIIMIESEQMRVNSVSSNNLLIGVGGTNVAGRGFNGTTAATHADNLQVYKVEELTASAAVDWRGKTVAQKAVIKTVYNHGVDEKTWNARINGFKIYMRDVTDGDESKEWRLFSNVNFNKGTYTIFAADDSEVILEQPGTWSSDGAVASITAGTSIKIKPVDTYLSENLFTEDTIIDAQYKCSEIVGRKMYIGNIKQGGKTYPDRMIRTPINKFDTFPETNYIDVAVGDGDAIVALESFGDRLLQFKRNKLFVINISGQSEILESEYPNAGIYSRSQVTKTSTGIAWVNSSGLWFFDGNQVTNLTRHLQENLTTGLGSIFAEESTSNYLIGYEKYSNRVAFTDAIQSGLLTQWRIYDMDLQAYQNTYLGDFAPWGTANYYTNFLTDTQGNLVFGYTSSNEPTKMNFYGWKNHAGEGQSTAFNTLWTSKDFDFGSPSIRKKIYKVYVTYKCTGHSGVKLKYATNGSETFSDFSTSKSTNYNVDSFSSNGDQSGFTNTSGAWTVAELKPSSSINNVKSFQLQFEQFDPFETGDAQAGSDNTTTTIKLASDASSVNGAYNDYNIFIYEGDARYNVRTIENGTNGVTYNGSTKVATVLSAWEDKGYGNIPGSKNTSETDTSQYLIPAIATDFEINDITIVYRMKPIK